ncbi:MAG: SpoIIE family protein phosphatase [Bacteroidota bacterium]
MFKNVVDIDKKEWTLELEKSAFKYHLLIAKVALILNPLWAIGDLFNIPDHFIDFLVFRVCVSILIFITIIYRKNFVNFPQIIALVPFIGISIQNAYMYSVMDSEEIQKHTFAYIALFIGAGMFVLWEIKYSIWVVIISFISNIVCFSIFGQLKLDEVLTNGGLLTLSVALFTILLINTRTNLNIKEIKSRLTLALTYNQLEEKTEIIESQNNDIISSINYAQRIQQAILPPKEKIDSLFKEYFILYQPKDIVSGDFYWLSTVNTTPKDKSKGESLVVLGAVDCTGHGVPGALMSIIGNTILNQSLGVKHVNSPAQALNYLNTEIVKNLSSIKDGMDLAMCAINFEKMELHYAGANNPLYLIRKKELHITKADKQAIGGDFDAEHEKTFTDHTIKLEKGDCIYIFTDGYADQFGGAESYSGGKKFKYNRFKDLLLLIHHLPMEEQKERLIKEHNQWKGDLEQVDDILVIGFRV